MKEEEMLSEEPTVYCLGEMTPIEKIKPNPDNPNVHPDEQIQMMTGVLRVNGWREAIIVSRRSGFVVKGHGRLLTAKAMKLRTVPVEYQDYADEQAELADMIADNRMAQHSYVDALGLGKLLKKMSSKGQEHLGYNQEEIGLFMAAEYVAPKETDRQFVVLETLKMTKECKAVISRAVQKYCLIQRKEIDWGEALASICIHWEAGLPPMPEPAPEPPKEPKPKKEPKTTPAEPTTAPTAPTQSTKSFKVKRVAGTMLQDDAVTVIRSDDDEKLYTKNSQVVKDCREAKEAGVKISASIEVRDGISWIVFVGDKGELPNVQA